ncbi:GYD domain-containing protein [Candidatus Bathyarchaeota archaeon]|nr:GYD domain-containing protein [Candidatus Bathyarchaeota archaeon]
MPIYVCLMKLTDQGIREIKNAPKRIQEAIKALEAMGGKLIAFYMVMGEYDYVGIAEAPSDEVAAAFLLGLGSSGYVRTTTLKAFTTEQIAAIVGRLP